MLWVSLESPRMLWVLVRIASARDSNEHPQPRILWRNNQIIPKLSLNTLLIYSTVL